MPRQKHAKYLEKEWDLEEAKDLLHRGLRKVAIFGAALLVNIASILPFLAGHSLHTYADRIGKYLILLAMVLATLFSSVWGRLLSFGLISTILGSPRGRELVDSLAMNGIPSIAFFYEIPQVARPLILNLWVPQICGFQAWI